jgi:DNA-binding MarR family transcriptional regulator
MHCYCATVRRLSRRLTRIYERELREAEMNPAQYELMSYLKAYPGSSQAALAVALDLDQTTLSRNLKVLMEQGRVLSVVDKRDARRVEYRLSRKGERDLKAAHLCWKRAMETVERELPHPEGVWQSLDALAEAMG